MSPESYLRSTLAAALGHLASPAGEAAPAPPALASLPPGFERALLDALTGAEDLDARYPHPLQANALPRVLPDLHAELAALARAGAEAAREAATPEVLCARWPGDRPFALLLSHDIDQIHDREFWRVLADVNHIRRVLQQGEHGQVSLALRRLARALFRPKPATKDYDTILAVEQRHGFRSTFFVLHDRYWARQGARFSIHDPEMRTIAQRARSAGCEVTVHGGFYRFNDAALYRQSREEVGRAFGVEPVGIRNHLLRYSYPGTWRAHAEAGFQYDATYGYNCRPGPRSGLALPFFAYDREREARLDLLVLPLTVMDTNLYRYLRLRGEEALEYTWPLVQRLAEHGALVTLLWHGNFFNEPEYWDWQFAYERLLERLEPLKPWCATGAEINQWWRARTALRLTPLTRQGAGWRMRLEAGAPIAEAVLRLRPAARIGAVTVEVPGAEVQRADDAVRVNLPELAAGQSVGIAVEAIPGR